MKAKQQPKRTVSTQELRTEKKTNTQNIKLVNLKKPTAQTPVTSKATSKYHLSEAELEKLAQDFRTREVNLERKEVELRKLVGENEPIVESLMDARNPKKSKLDDLKQIFQNNKKMMEEKFKERELELARRERDEREAEAEVEAAKAEVAAAITIKDVEVSKAQAAVDVLEKQVNKLKDDLFILTAEVESKEAEFYILKDARKTNTNVDLDEVDKKLTLLKRSHHDLSKMLTEKSGQLRLASDKLEWTTKEFENRVLDKEFILNIALERLTEIRKHADLESSIDIIAHDRESAESIPSMVVYNDNLKEVIEKPLGDEHKTVSLVLNDHATREELMSQHRNNSRTAEMNLLEAPVSARTYTTNEMPAQPANHSTYTPSHTQPTYSPSNSYKPAKTGGKSTGFIVGIAVLSVLLIAAIVLIALGFTVLNWF